MSATLICLLLSFFLGAAGPMQRLELKLPGRVSSVVPADVNGDGLVDFLVFWRQGFPPHTTKRVSVYPATAGKISTRPTQVIALPRGTVAFDVGDVNFDGLADVLLLRADGVWSLAGQPTGGLASSPKREVKVMTMAAIPHEDSVPRISLLVELGDGRRGLLVPSVPIGPLALYVRSAQSAWSLQRTLRVPTRAELYTSAEDFRSARDYGALFMISVPRWQAEDQNADGRPDLMFFSRNSVAVYRQRADGSFPAGPDLLRSFSMLEREERIKRGAHVQIRAGDLNGDGRTDLVINKTVGGISNMKSELRVYLADDACDYPPRADFQSRRDGWGSSVSLCDMNTDGCLDLVRPHVEMGLSSLIGMMLAGKLNVDFEIYFSQKGVFTDRPDFVIPSKLRIDFASNQELTGPYPNFRSDFDGDGLLDLVIGRAGGGTGDNPDRIEIRRGRGKGRFSDDVLWSADLCGTRYVIPFRPRPNGRPGLLIYFPLIASRRGDVWVLYNVGPWR